MIQALFLILSVGLVAEAQSPMAKDYKGLRVVGFTGSVVVTADAKADPVQVRLTSKAPGAPWDPITQVVDGWLEVKVPGSLVKGDWRNPIPPVALEIRSPSMPLEIAWKTGEVSLKGWRHPAQIVQQNGKLKTEDTQEALKLSLHEGELEVLQHKGKLNLLNYGAKVTLKKLTGSSYIENFQGRLVYSESEGDVTLRASRSKNKLSLTKSNFDFDTQNSELEFSQEEGLSRGTADGGQVLAQLEGAVDLRVRADSAKVSIGLKRGFGAKMDLGTQEGSITNSFGLKLERLENLRWVKGSAPGKEGSSVFVRTKTGDIRARSL